VHVVSQIVEASEASVFRYPDWQKQPLYVCTFVTGAPGGMQTVCALSSVGQVCAQEGRSPVPNWRIWICAVAMDARAERIKVDLMVGDGGRR